MRTPTTSTRGGGTPFGWQKAGQAWEPVEAEQVVLARILTLRDEGLGYKRLAAVLTAEGHPTRRGGPWRGSVVGRILRWHGRGDRPSTSAPGGNRIPLGYGYRDGRLVLLPEGRALIDRILALRAARYTVLEIARKLEEEGYRPRQGARLQHRTLRAILLREGAWAPLRRLRWAGPARRLLRRLHRIRLHLERRPSGIRLPLPRTRGDCQALPRPCPYTSCRHHLWDAGFQRRAAPGGSCALDFADRGGLTLEQVGEVLGVDRERVRQIEEVALRKLRYHQRHRLEDLRPEETEPLWRSGRRGP